MADEDATNTNEEQPTQEPETSAEEAVDAAQQAAQDAAEQTGQDEAPTQEEADAIAAAAAAIGQLNDEADTGADPASGSTGVEMPEFAQGLVDGADESIELLSDVKLNVRIELGRTRMLVEDILKLGSGAVVELDKLAGDPVDVFVNDRHVAKGEVLVLNDNFCVRVSEIISPTAEG